MARPTKPIDHSLTFVVGLAVFLAVAAWLVAHTENSLPFSSPQYVLSEGRINYVYNEPRRGRTKAHVIFGIEGNQARYFTTAVSSMDPTWPSGRVSVSTYDQRDHMESMTRIAYGLWVDGKQYESLEDAHASRVRSVYTGWCFAAVLLALAAMCANGLYKSWSTASEA